MESADILCKSLFIWLENRKECAKELLQLKQELEDVPQHSNIAQVFGALATISAVAFIPVFTGLAWPILFEAESIVSSTAVSPPVSSSTLNKAIELMKVDETVGTRIQKQLRDLKDGCRKAQKDRCGKAHADDLDCEVVTRLMWALAEKRKTPVPLDFLRDFNRATFFRHMTPGGLDPDKASDLICKALGLDCSPEITSSLKVSAKEMMKNIELIGIKAAKAGSEEQGASGLGISLYDLIGNLGNLNQDTETGKFLRDSAREILDGQQKLKEQLDAMHEIIQKLFRLKNLIKNLGGYSLCMTEDGRKIMDYIRGTRKDDTVVWLQELMHQIQFVNLLRFCLDRFGCFLSGLQCFCQKELDVVIVAHGRIVDQFMPSAGLVPRPSISDTILYSPWNCGIDSSAAFTIAQGNIHFTNREFYNNSDIAHCEPIPLPGRWNSMRRSLHNIPVIYLFPVTHEERQWKLFELLWQNKGMEIDGRIIIPYLVPQDEVNAFEQIPLYILILAISYILSYYEKTATVHLAACLGRGRSPLMPEERVRQEWVRQYAYTNDGTIMTVNLENMYMNTELFRALSSMFGSNHR